jgi:CRP/FNR family transcriptional regulator, cyclic AMP receptor protein
MTMTLDSIWKNLFHKSSSADMVEIMSKLPIFENVSKLDIKRVYRLLHIRTYSFDEAVFEEKQPGSGMYIIQKGSIDIVIKEGFKEPKTVATYLEGDFFGEMALLDECPRSAAAIAKEDNTVLLGFFRPDLISMLDSFPQIASKIIFNLATILSTRLRESNQMLRKLQAND